MAALYRSTGARDQSAPAAGRSETVRAPSPALHEPPPAIYRRGRMRIPSWLRTAVALVLLALAITAAATRTWRNRVVPGDVTQPRYGFNDFRDGVYYPTLAFVSGDNPADAETYLRKY